MRDQSNGSCEILRIRCKSAWEALGRGRLALIRSRKFSSSGDSGTLGLGFLWNIFSCVKDWSSAWGSMPDNVEYEETAMPCFAARLPVDLSEFFIVRKFFVLVPRSGLLHHEFPAFAKPDAPKSCIRVPAGTQQPLVDPCHLFNFATWEQVEEQTKDDAC